MAQITLEPGDRITFPTENPRYRGYGMILSNDIAFLIEVGSRMGQAQRIGPIPGGAKLLQETVSNEVNVVLNAVQIVLNNAKTSVGN